LWVKNAFIPANPHQGYRLKGRTPAMALQQALQIDTLPPLIPEPEETEETIPDTLAA
jgi:hypothetical protein